MMIRQRVECWRRTSKSWSSLFLIRHLADGTALGWMIGKPHRFSQFFLSDMPRFPRNQYSSQTVYLTFGRTWRHVDDRKFGLLFDRSSSHNTKQMYNIIFKCIIPGFTAAVSPHTKRTQCLMRVRPLSLLVLTGRPKNSNARLEK